MSKRYHKLWPEQARAKWTVRNRLRAGTLVKTDHCERCKEPKLYVELEAHHWSYLKKHHADVFWFCKKCHKEEHKEMGPDWKGSAVRPTYRTEGVQV